MSVANLIDRGSAINVEYAIVIEGWPHIWVTSPRVTLSSVLSGRSVRHGLLHEGIEIREQTIPSEGRLEGGSITFRIVSANAADEATASFCNYPDAPVAQLEGALTTGGTTLDIVGSSSLSDGYYYIGTETIQVSTFPTIVRGRHASYAQVHPVSTLENGDTPVYVWDTPPALEGRRVSLYMWTDDDDVTQFNDVVWRGYIQTPAKLGTDGLTWGITASHISAVMQQTLAPSNFRTRIQGIYHSYQCTVELTAQYNTNGRAERHVSGYHATPQDLADDVQTELDAIMTELSATAHTLTFHYDEGRGEYFLRLTTDATPPTTFPVFAGSPLIGMAHGFNWFTEDGEAVHNTNLVGSTTYIRYLNEMAPSFLLSGPAQDSDPDPPDKPLFPGAYLGRHIFSHISNTFGNITFTDNDASGSAPANRFYISDDLSVLAANDSVIFDVESGTVAERGHRVSTASSDSNGYYIELDIGNAIVSAYITGDTEISGVSTYATGNVSDFITALETRGSDANNGLVPHVVVDDFGTSTIPDSLAAQHERSYQFAADVAIEDVLAMEAKFYGCMWSTNSTGQPYLRPLPLLSAGSAAAYEVDTSSIVTPYGNAGAWPGVHIQRDGSVNTVVVQDDYRHEEDDWAGPRFVIKNLPAIAEAKNKGRGTVEVKPYSRSAQVELDAKDARQIAGRLLTLMARPYMTVTLDVTWHAFGIRLGDIVSLTCPQAPNGRGGRGLVSKKCFVVERQWRMDPGAGGAPGRLVLWALLNDFAGYAPSAWVTAEADQGSDLWHLTVDSSDEMNIALSQEGDGKVLQHFTAGDYVRIYEIDNQNGDTQTGQVTSVLQSSDLIAVQFDGTFANSASQYVLEFDNAATGSTEEQQKYAYAADSDLTLADGTSVRRIA